MFMLKEDTSAGVVAVAEKPAGRSGEDIMSVLLQHEKRDGGGAVDAAVKSVKSALPSRDSDSNDSDEETKPEPPAKGEPLPYLLIS